MHDHDGRGWSRAATQLSLSVHYVRLAFKFHLRDHVYSSPFISLNTKARGFGIRASCPPLSTRLFFFVWSRRVAVNDSSLSRCAPHRRVTTNVVTWATSMSHSVSSCVKDEENACVYQLRKRPLLSLVLPEQAEVGINSDAKDMRALLLSLKRAILAKTCICNFGYIQQCRECTMY